MYERSGSDPEVLINAGSLGIPRAGMPQIKSDYVPEFLASFAEKGIKVTKGLILVSDLKPTQAELNLDKAKEMLAALPEKALAKSIIVSSDNYILDGHHRWAALRISNDKAKIQANKVDLPIRELIKAANAFDKVKYKKVDEAMKTRIQSLRALVLSKNLPSSVVEAAKYCQSCGTKVSGKECHNCDSTDLGPKPPAAKKAGAGRCPECGVALNKNTVSNGECDKCGAKIADAKKYESLSARHLAGLDSILPRLEADSSRTCEIDGHMFGGASTCERCGAPAASSSPPKTPKAKSQTYVQARGNILDYLGAQKWVVKANLKIPHATSPDGSVRVWFKAQAVYITTGNKHQYGDARTLDYSHDIRKMDGPGFVSYVLGDAKKSQTENADDALMKKIGGYLENVEKYFDEFDRNIFGLAADLESGVKKLPSSPVGGGDDAWGPPTEGNPLRKALSDLAYAIKSKMGWSQYYKSVTAALTKANAQNKKS